VIASEVPYRKVENSNMPEGPNTSQRLANYMLSSALGVPLLGGVMELALGHKSYGTIAVTRCTISNCDALPMKSAAASVCE
jgi:hypothetical protein